MAGRKSMAAFRSLAGLFTVAFAGALVVLALLGNYGLPDTVLGTTLGVGVVIAFAACRGERTHHAAGGVPHCRRRPVGAGQRHCHGRCLSFGGRAVRARGRGVLRLSRRHRDHARLVARLPAARRPHRALSAQVRHLRRRRFPRLPLRQSRRAAGRRRHRRADPGSGAGRGDCHRNAGRRPAVRAVAARGDGPGRAAHPVRHGARRHAGGDADGAGAIHRARHRLRRTDRDRLDHRLFASPSADRGRARLSRCGDAGRVVRRSRGTAGEPFPAAGAGRQLPAHRGHGRRLPPASPRCRIS